MLLDLRNGSKPGLIIGASLDKEEEADYHTFFLPVPKAGGLCYSPVTGNTDNTYTKGNHKSDKKKNCSLPLGFTTFTAFSLSCLTVLSSSPFFRKLRSNGVSDVVKFMEF
jgi:hypothetical protein